MSREIKVKSIADSLDYILEHRCSVARFGDGEIELMAGHSIPYQEYNEQLAARLREIIALESNEQFLVCIPDVFENLERYNEQARHFWSGDNAHFDHYGEFYNTNCQASWYGSTFISRPYIDLADKSQSAIYFEQLKTIWQGQDVLIVEGTTTRSGVGNDLFAGVKSLSRVVCPSTNAYSHYDAIAAAIRQHGQGKLVLLMLGPTAKVLSYDLAKEGFWTIDIGHIDSEYEWFLMGATEKIELQQKQTIDLTAYDRQVVDFIPKPLVSVIVPVYNVQAYLKQCIHSLMQQTYENLEIILVNDGSTDGSDLICEQLSQEDFRIKFINKDNTGVSDSRNIALDLATGDYVTFVDSDDFISENYVERLCQAAIVHRAKIVVGEYYRLSDANFWFHTSESYVKYVDSIEYLDKMFIAETLAFVIACGSLFDRELFNGQFPIRFPKDFIVGEDKSVTYLLALKTDQIVYVHEPLYCYRHREGSATTASTSLKRASDDITATEQQISDLVLAGYDLKHIISWYQYILLVHKEHLRAAGLTDNPLYQKIKKKIALFKHEYR